MTRLGRFRWALWSGWAVLVLSLVLTALLEVGTKPVPWVFIFFVLGLGQGLILIPPVYCIQASVETGDVAYAAAMYAFLRTFGMCIGVAIGGSGFQNLLLQHLSDEGLPSSVASDAEAYVAALKSASASQTRQHVVEAYAQEFRGFFEVMLGISVLGLLFSLTVAHQTLDQVHLSGHVLRRKGKKWRGCRQCQ